MPTAPSTALRFPSSRFFRPLIARAGGVLRSLLIPSQPFPADVPDTPWDQFWGEAYGPDLKKWLLKPVFEDLEKRDSLGDVIVDAGSGAQPVTQLLPPRAARRCVLVDIAAVEATFPDAIRIRLDVENVAQPRSLGLRKAVLRARNFLGSAGVGGVDTMIFSDLLNYVDFRAVLAGALRFLKPGGRFIVVNLPIRGNQLLFSERGLKDNRDLYVFLQEGGFEIEQKLFPCRPRGSTEEAEELIILVARASLAGLIV